MGALLLIFFAAVIGEEHQSEHPNYRLVASILLLVAMTFCVAVAVVLVVTRKEKIDAPALVGAITLGVMMPLFGVTFGNLVREREGFKDY